MKANNNNIWRLILNQSNVERVNWEKNQFKTKQKIFNSKKIKSTHVKLPNMQYISWEGDNPIKSIIKKKIVAQSLAIPMLEDKIKKILILKRIKKWLSQHKTTC